MHQSEKKNTRSKTPFQSPAPKNTKSPLSVNKSVKSLASHDSIGKGSDIETEIKNTMKEDLYKRVFEKLTKIQNLKEFVSQASEYIDFHQSQVQKYIPSSNSKKVRLSWSFKQPNSVCALLERDYRFLKHYLKLLEKQFPGRNPSFKSELYNHYKDLVLDTNKFEKYFASGQENVKTLKEKTAPEKSLKIKMPLSEAKSVKSRKPALSISSAAKSLNKKTQIDPEKALKNTQKQKEQQKIQTKQKENSATVFKSSKTSKQQKIKPTSYQNYRKIVTTEQKLITNNSQTLEKQIKQVENIFASSYAPEEAREAKQNLHPNAQNIFSASQKKEKPCPNLARFSSPIKKTPKRSLDEKLLQSLAPDEQDILSLFPRIKEIGETKMFEFDKDCFSHVKLGQCLGYELEIVHCWSKDDDDKPEVGLYLKKITNSFDRDDNESRDYSEDIERLKEKIEEYAETDWITLLFIQKRKANI